MESLLLNALKRYDVISQKLYCLGKIVPLAPDSGKLYCLKLYRMHKQCFFFSGNYRKWGMTKWPDRKATIFQNFQTLLTSSWERFRRKIPGKKRKFRRAARANKDRREGKNKRISFLILVSSDQKPQNSVFSLNLLLKQGARSARKFLGVFLCERSEHATKSRRQSTR